MMKRALIAVILLIAGTAAGTQIAHDYYDCGWIGLVMVVCAGWIVAFAAARWARATEVILTATLAVLPWSLGLGGLAYVGFFLLPLEIAATAFVLHRNTSFRGWKAASVAVLVRLIAFAPLLACRSLQ